MKLESEIIAKGFGFKESTIGLMYVMEDDLSHYVEKINKEASEDKNDN